MNLNGKLQILHHIRASLIHHIMSIAAVMQLFTCPFDNDTSHVQLYLTLGMLSCRMTHICFHRNRRFQRGLCNWIWWICPFMDNRVVQLWGHQRALTPSWPMLHPPVDAAGWAALPDFFTSSSLPLTLPHFLYILCTRVCFCVWLAQIPKPWGSNLAASVLSFTSHCQTSPPLPALLTQPTASYSNLLPPLEREPCLFFFHHPFTVHSSNHDALVSTLSKWVMKCNYGLISRINANCCNYIFCVIHVEFNGLRHCYFSY